MTNSPALATRWRTGRRPQQWRRSGGICDTFRVNKWFFIVFEIKRRILVAYLVELANLACSFRDTQTGMPMIMAGTDIEAWKEQFKFVICKIVGISVR